MIFFLIRKARQSYWTMRKSKCKHFDKRKIMEAIETTATVQNGIMVDALPYIDLGYDEPGVREAVG